MKNHAFHIRALVLVFLIAPCLISPKPCEAAGTQSIRVQPGWNLISLPVKLSNARRDSLFPTAISSAYVYSAGYQAKETLKHGEGFWLKFASADTIFVEGDMIFGDTIDVYPGWNIIGSLSLNAVTDSIRTSPGGIIVSQFYGFVPEVGYQQADTLHPGLGYWVKASESGQLIIPAAEGSSCPGVPKVTYAGKTYNTVQIGDQCWLKENLDVGTMLPGTSAQTDNAIAGLSSPSPANEETNVWTSPTLGWRSSDSHIEKYCYNNDTVSCNTDGGLYQWDEAMQYVTNEGAQGICPPGWTIPTYAQLQMLSSTVGGDGNALKAIEQGSGAGAGTDSSGFSALLTGGRWGDGGFGNHDNFGYVWSSTQFDAPTARLLVLAHDNSNIILNTRYFKYEGFNVRCIKGETPVPPPGEPPTYDVYFDTNNPPATIISPDQTDSSLTLSGLMAGTTYYWKVARKDSSGSTVGPVWSFTTQSGGGSPCPGVPTVMHEGIVYHTVMIGTQCWLRENLDVGTMVAGGTGQTDNATIEMYCYDDDTANCATYGGLYQWDEAMQYAANEGPQGLCPSGWHVPTYTEFQTLNSAVGGNGNMLKEIGQGADMGAGTNTSGFSALLAGAYASGSGFSNLSLGGYFWSSTGFTETGALKLSVNWGTSSISLSSYARGFAMSVRCLKGAAPDAPSHPTPDSGEKNVWTSTTLGWSCADPDGDPLTYDVYFGTDNPPATMVSSDQTDTSLARIGLTSGTTYYWRVVAKDGGIAIPGPVWNFTIQSGGGEPCAGVPTIYYEGKTYHTVQIGTQCWLRENLDVGTRVAGVNQQYDNGIIEKYCYHDNPSNCTIYGGLYQWNEAVQYHLNQGVQGICPPGWHIPTMPDFQTLYGTVGGDGNALKEIGVGAGAGAGTNTSGFSALLGGIRYGVSVYDVVWEWIDYNGFFWTTHRHIPGNADPLILYDDRPLIDMSYNYGDVRHGFSVRCIMN